MRRVVRAIALLYSLVHFVRSGVVQPVANFYGDFLATFPAWRIAALFGRLDLHAGSLAAQTIAPPLWFYGPVEHLLTLPLLAFPTLRSAYLAWYAVSLAFVVVTAILAARIVDDAFVVVLVFCNFNPLYEALTQRNIELFELMLLFAAYLLYRRERNAASGLALGTAAMSKFLPLIFLPWLALRGRWRALGAAIAVIVPVAIATQLVLGWEHSATFLQLREGSFSGSELDQSIAGVVRRLAEPASVPMLSRAISAAALLALSALLLRTRRSEDVEDLELGILAVAMIVFLPHNQNYYFVFLLFPYALLYARYRAEWSWRAALLALSFALVAVPIPLTLVQRLTGVDVFHLYLQAGVPFVGAALLAFVLVADLAAHAVTSTAALRHEELDVVQI